MLICALGGPKPRPSLAGKLSSDAAEALGAAALAGIPVFHSCGDAGASTLGYVVAFTLLSLWALQRKFWQHVHIGLGDR
jgi:hypothetical protein